MNVLVTAIGVTFGVLLSALVSAVETGSYRLNRVRLRLRQDQNAPGARTLARLIEHQEDLLMVTLVGNTIADYITTAAITAALVAIAIPDAQAELTATALVTPLLLVLGGILPKGWAARRADRLMYAVAWPCWLAVEAARWSGFSLAMRRLSTWTMRIVAPNAADPSRDTAARGHILQLLHEGALRGGLSAEQSSMMERVLTLSEVPVFRVMIPWARTANVSIDLPRDDFLRIARMAHFSRLPVCEGGPARVVGVINVYDVLTDDEKRPIRAHVRPALTLPAGRAVSDALVKLQESRQAMAVVVDGRGQSVGILTVKDLVEEIVGELAVW